MQKEIINPEKLAKRYYALYEEIGDHELALDYLEFETGFNEETILKKYIREGEKKLLSSNKKKC